LENINEANVNSVDISVFPIQGEHGNSIAGKCDIFRGRIRIYPKTIKFCKTLSRELGRNTLFSYAGNRARAALIHELLHIKYTNNEEKVRELTKVYFSTYTKKQFVNKPDAVSAMYKLIFDAKNARKDLPNKTFLVNGRSRPVLM
jgi:hypothetical protein